MYNFDEIISREKTDSVKFDSIKAGGKYPEDIIPMFVADMDFACPEEIIKAISKRLSRRILGYTTIVDESYYDILFNWFETRFNWHPKIKPVISHGVVTAINNLVKLVTKQGEGVIIFTPSYSPFKGAVDKAEGRECVYCPLIYQNTEYSVDFELFERLCKEEKNTMFILCNPHNPTGKAWSAEELKRIGEICFNNGVYIISDEIHADLTRSNVTVTPFAKLFPDEKNMAVCTAPSKTFNLAGMQLSNIFIYDEKIEEAWMNAYNMMPNPLSLEAAKAAYSCSCDWLDELRIYIDNNLRYIKDFVDNNLSKAKYNISDATYLAWLDLSEYGYENEELEALIAEGGVLVEAGHQFVSNAEGFIRINCACPLSVIKEAMNRIKVTLNA